jgi:hypothetical protein
MKLQGRLRTIESLDSREISAMFAIMQKYYQKITEAEFLSDLNNKDWVIVLVSDTRICGFSTQKLIELTIENEKIMVVFSGDTIIEKDSWGTTALPIAFGRMMLDIKKKYKQNDLYWFLTSKGFRTYRFLPVFFKEFYPTFNVKVPPLAKRILMELGQMAYADRFDHDRFIIRAMEDSQRLRPGVGDLPESRCKDRHIAFFAETNPDYWRGDELACIAKFEEANLTSFILKRLKDKQPEGAAG